ncbi:hypothetical protein [Microlunatus sp. GCM10028923]|uniref:hypothetical protein n=1 Tax=Microlunatus sp. GCM10028923 TaxID=3273400 RepID=UPI0036133729
MRAAVSLRWSRYLGALLAALAVVMLSSAAPAWALPDDPEAPIQSVCATDGTADYQYLPVERWSGATQKMHIRSGGGGPFDFAPFQREFQGGAFAVGDFFYSVTTKFVTWSTEFCPLQSIGLTIDQTVARFGDAVLQSPLLAGIVGLAAIGLLIRGLKQDPGWLMRLVVKMIIVAILVIMVVGAGSSTKDASGRYKPGQGSPGWFATMIDEAITEIAAAPAAALEGPSAYGTVGVDQDELSCGDYVDALKRGYESSALAKGAVIKAKSIPAQTVSNLWQLSGYRAWSVGQFGRDNLNGQNRVACRMLDANAGIPAGLEAFPTEGQDDAQHRSAATRTAVLRLASDNPSELVVNPRAPAWRPLNRVEQDKAWIAWASCVPSGDKLANLKAPTGWHTPRGQSWLLKDEDERAQAEEGKSEDFDKACFAFFNTEGDSVASIFDWGDGDGELKKVAGDMPHSIYDFISALHGTNQGASNSALIGYVLSALGVAAVFGTIGVTIMIVKAVAAFMLLSAIFVAIICLLPNADNNRMIQFVKVYVGLSLTAAFAIFILSLITLLTNVILNVIKGFTGPNSDMTLILGGLAPVMAAIALHFAFHKAGMPSPMTVKGAMAWGGALSGGAGLSAIGTGTQQLVERGQGLLRRRGRGDDEEATSKGSAGKLGKRNSELNTEQGLRPKAAPGGPVGPTPDEILNDPDASEQDIRTAQRRRMSQNSIRLPSPEVGPAGEPSGAASNASAAESLRRTVPPAKFGSAENTNYRQTFREAHPDIADSVVVHHAVEQQAMRKYPSAGITPNQMHSLENLRGIPKGDVNNKVHLSGLRKDWNRFYRDNPEATQQQLLDYATKLDEKYGSHFDPQVRWK